MSFSKLLFKKEPTQQRLTLDHSELLVLKELASFFLSVDFHGSQLEALLRNRASQASPLEYVNDNTVSILTPSPASESEADADTPIIQPPLSPTPSSSVLPSVLEPELEAFEGIESPSASSTRPIVVDCSFENCIIDGTGCTEPIVIDSFSHRQNEIDYSRLETRAFSHSTIRNSTVNNHSYNGNTDCFTTNLGTAATPVINWHYGY